MKLFCIAILLANNAFSSSPLGRLGGAICPERDGLAVYQARILYNSINNIFTVFEGNCAKVSTARIGHTEEINDVTFEPNNYVIDIYPNPNNGKAIINMMEAGITKATLKVYDVNGRVVYEDVIQNINGKNYELNLNTISGIYFVEVKDTENEQVYKQKLIINK